MLKKLDFGIRKIVRRNEDFFIKLPRIYVRNFGIKEGSKVSFVVDEDGRIILEVKNDRS